MGALDDRELAAEIALLGEVLAEVAAVARVLTDSEVDQVLGVSSGPRPAAGEPGLAGGEGRPTESGQ